MKRSGFKMKGYTYPGSPVKHAPYAEAHTKAEGKVAHDNTAEAHGKKSEDYYDGSKGKVIQSTGASRGTFGDHSYSKKKEEE
tara:strand:+ start:350 stop:595 length:246 start_codon:yes stop_codon:yes gene_type:complete